MIIAYAEKLLTDEEFLFLYEANKPVNLELPYYEYEEFNLEENISEAECKVEFRFERGDIERLADVLQLPPTFECPQGSVCDWIEGLWILLRRFAYPCHYTCLVGLQDQFPFVYDIEHRAEVYLRSSSSENHSLESGYSQAMLMLCLTKELLLTTVLGL